jgi:hypothetical protein
MEGKQEEMKSEVVLDRHVCFSSSCAWWCPLMFKPVIWVTSFIFCWLLGALGVKLRDLLSLSQAGWVRRRDYSSLSHSPPFLSLVDTLCVSVPLVMEMGASPRVGKNNIKHV